MLAQSDSGDCSRNRIARSEEDRDTMKVPNARRVLPVLAALLGISLAAAPVAADPAAWAAFQIASCTDIYLTPAFTTDQLDYTLSIGAAPEITIGPDTFAVNWLQACYVVSQDDVTPFTATDGLVVTDWMWESQTVAGYVAGWFGTGMNRLLPAQSKALGFGTFDITGNAVLVGLHVGYQSGSEEISGFFKTDLPMVPEPSSILALLFGTAGLAGWRRSR